jgi:peptide/nickel transport system substrate-binding protein
MWGKLPAPKYLAHVIFKDNAAGTTALQAGEVDVSQQFNSNIQDLWLEHGLPISTYLPEAPYGIGASLPTAFYNLKSPVWTRWPSARPSPWRWTMTPSSPTR